MLHLCLTKPSVKGPDTSNNRFVSASNMSIIPPYFFHNFFHLLLLLLASASKVAIHFCLFFIDLALDVLGWDSRSGPKERWRPPIEVFDEISLNNFHFLWIWFWFLSVQCIFNKVILWRLVSNHKSTPNDDLWCIWFFIYLLFYCNASGHLCCHYALLYLHAPELHVIQTHDGFTLFPQ